MLGKGDRLTTPEISALCLSSEQRALSIPSAAPALCPSPDLREQLLREQLPHPSAPLVYWSHIPSDGAGGAAGSMSLCQGLLQVRREMMIHT